jgi:hypothetical protein
MAEHMQPENTVERISHDLFPEFEGTPQEESVKQVVAAEVDRWREVPVKDHVPIFVERRLRTRHRLARSF